MFAIFINGGYGVGKSSTLEHVGDILVQKDKPFSLMDVDWFHRSWPTAESDPKNVNIEAINIAAVWKNYLKAGPRQLVICGVIHSGGDRERYEAALGMPVRSILLDASQEVQESRLRGRYSAERSMPLQWHLAHYVELAEQLRHSHVDETTILTDTLTPFVVAEKVLQHFRLLEHAQTSYCTRHI